MIIPGNIPVVFKGGSLAQHKPRMHNLSNLKGRRRYVKWIHCKYMYSESVLFSDISSPQSLYVDMIY